MEKYQMKQKNFILKNSKFETNFETNRTKVEKKKKKDTFERFDDLENCRNYVPHINFDI